MKRNVKNDKVIRAITIGLATMIAATSAPVNVFAGEDEDGAADSSSASVSSEAHEESTSPESSEQSVSAEQSTPDISQETQSIGETAVDVTNIDNRYFPENPTADFPGAPGVVNEAIDQVGDLTPVANLVDQQTITDVTTLLTNEAENPDDMGAIQLINLVDGELDTAITDLNTAYVDAANAEAETKKAEKIVNDDTVKKEVKKYNDADKATTDDANDAIDDANVANTSNSKEEAYAAKDSAEAELADAEDGLKIAEAAYNAAETAYNEADTALNKAKEEQKEAQEKLAEAKGLLSDANMNATAAQERLKAAQSKMERIEKEVTQLERVQQQYYNFMVHYYRDNNIGCAVYYDNDITDDEGNVIHKKGELDIAASAAKAAESDKTNNPGFASNSNTVKVGRQLMEELIKCKLIAKGVDIDPDADLEFVESTEKGAVNKTQIAAEGDLVKDNKGNDRVTVDDNDTHEQKWDYRSGDDGRTHNVTIKYTVKVEEDGKLVDKEITEHYNYIYEAKKYNGTDSNFDLSNGPVYLALIEVDEKGKASYKRDEDADNFDDYNKVTQTLSDYKKAEEEYKQAKAAVDEAEEVVEGLRGQIAELETESLNVDDSKIKELEEKLADAKAELDDAKEKKDILNDKVEEARKAVAAIDLSRFNKGSDDDADPDDPDPADPTPGPGPASDPVVPSVPTDIVIPSPADIPVMPAPVLPLSGVAGVRVPEVFGVMDNVANDDIKPAIVADTTGKKVDNKKIVRIDNEEIPLAAMPDMVDEDGVKINWWWLLVIFLLGATGKKMYEDHKKKVEAREAAKNIDK